MSSKDAPPQQGGTTDASNDNDSEALGFIENMVAHAVADDDYRVVPMPNFDHDTIVGTEVEAVDGDYHEQILLPAELRSDVLFVRVGHTLPSHVDIVVATRKRDLLALLSDGFGYDDYDEVELPIGGEMLQLQLGSDKAGDVSWL